MFWRSVSLYLQFEKVDSFIINVQELSMVNFVSYNF